MSEPYKTADKKSPEECPYPEMHKMFRYCAGGVHERGDELDRHADALAVLAGLFRRTFMAVRRG